MNSDLIALYVLSKSPKIRYGLVIGTLFLIGIAWLEFVYVPLRNLLNLKQQEFCALQKKLLTVEQQILRTAELRDQLIRMQNEVEYHATSVKQMQEEKFVSLINSINDHKLSLISWQPGQIVQKSWYCTNSLSCIIQGSFENFVAFFDDLARKKYVVCCKQLVMEKTEPFLKVYCMFNCISKQSQSYV